MKINSFVPKVLCCLTACIAGMAINSNATVSAFTNCFNYPNFALTSGLALTGNATVTNGVLRLTAAKDGQTGNTWLIEKQQCAAGFDTSFHFRITNLGNIFGNEPGGDGITFSVQRVGPTELAWGADKTNNYISVFFNTFWNWPGCNDYTNCDVSDNSVAIMTDKHYLTQVDLNPRGINMSDGAVHQARIAYDGTALTVWVDNVMVLTNVSVPGLQPGTDGSGQGWVGFTALTGAAYESHDILDWSFCANSSAPASCVPPPSGLISWWRAEGNATDSVDGNNGVLAGDATYGAGQAGQGFVFDGNTDRVTLGNPTNLQLQNFSIETWIKRSSDSRISFGTDGGGFLLSYGNAGYAFYLGGNAHLYFGKLGTVALPSTGTITDTNFHHVAMTKSGTTVTFYIDGVSNSVVSFSPTFEFTTPVAIGAQGDNADNSFLGTIDEMAVYNRPLSAAEIRSIYDARSAGKCPLPQAPSCTPAPANIISWWRAESNALDSVDGNHGTLLNGATYAPGKVGQGFSFDGVDDRVSVGDPENLKLTNSFTFESWINPSAYPTSGDGLGLILFRGDTRYCLDPYYVALMPYRLLRFHIGDETGCGVDLETVEIIPTNAWTHIAGVFDSSSGILRIYTNGSLAVQLSTTMKPFRNLTGGGVAIGNSDIGDGNAPFKGIIDEPSIYGRALSASEIQAIYNTGSAGKCFSGTPPSIVTQPQTQSVAAGTNVSFTVTATGTSPLTYQWKKNGTNISAATTSAYSISNVQLTNAGTYSVVVSNLFGGALSSNAVLTVTTNAPSCTAAPTGLVSWWRAESNALDSVDGNNGTLLNGTTYATGKVGKGFFFDGVNDQISLGDPENLKFTNSFTIECWISPNGFPGIPGIIFFRGDSRYCLDPYYLATMPGGAVRFHIATNDDANPCGVDLETAPIPNNQWCHVAGVFDAQQGRMQIFTNGSLAASVLTSVKPFRDLTSGGVTIGNSGVGFSGIIDELAVYNRALSITEIQGIYNASSAGKCQDAPLISEQPMSRIVDVGATTTFGVVASGTPQLRYQWRFNGTNILGATMPSLVLSNIQFSQAGSYSVRITNAFGSIISSNAILTVNRRPIANAQSLTNAEDTLLPITLTGSDPDGNLITYAVVSGPTNGTLSGTAPNLVYRPNTNFFGADGFFFRVNDGRINSETAKISITVTPVNDAPIASSQSVSVNEDTTLAITLSAFDPDGDALTYVVNPPSHGSLTGTAPNLLYHPDTNYFGPDSFTFRASDSVLESALATVSINVVSVNDAPFAQISVSPLANFPGVTNLVVIADGCTTNAEVVLDGSASSDVENDPLTFSWFDGTNLLATTAITTNLLGTGTHEITLDVSDGADTGTKSVTVEIVSASESIGFLIVQIEDSKLPQSSKRPLIVTLQAASQQFERCNFMAALKQLQAFQNKVRAQIAPSDPELAEELIDSAQVIIDALSPHSFRGNEKPRVLITE